MVTPHGSSEFLCKVKLLAVVADLPAKAPLLNYNTMASLDVVLVNIKESRYNSEAMASTEINRGRALREDNIPGASLGGRSANTLTIPALKRWL